MKTIIKPVLHITAAIILASALAPLVSGQQANPAPDQSGSGRNTSGRNSSRTSDSAALERAMRERDLRERMFQLEMLERMAREPAERPEPRLALAQIKEDYARIQVVNNALAQAVSGGGTLDLKFVAKSASEIKKRAARLKLNLVLPEPEKDAKRPKVEVGELKPALSVLNELIVGFVNNPMFKAANIVDAQESAKARRDLEAIIALSGQVKKSSEQLSKAAPQSQ